LSLPCLFNDGELDTLALGKGHPRLCTLADGEHIAKTGGKLMTRGILDVDGLKASLMLLPVLDDSNTSPIPSTSNHDNVPNIKLNEVDDLVGL